MKENVKFEEAMEVAGYGKFSMFIMFLCGMTVCCSLLCSLDIAFLMPSAECDLKLTSEDKGLLGSAYFIGAVSASHLSGFLADTLGRRYVLFRGLCLNVLAYILGAFAPDFWSFFALKIFCGVVTCPCMIASYPFLGEYMPATRRSQAMLVMTSLSSMALLYAALIGWATLQDQWEVDLRYIMFTPWRLFYLLCCLPSLLTSILFFLTPESPKFLLTRGKKGDTLKVLQRVHSINTGKLPQSYPVESVCVDQDEVLPTAREKGIGGVMKQFSNQTLPLLQPPYLKNLLICITITFICFFCVNSIFLWIPEVTNRIAEYRQTHEGHYPMCHMVASGNVSDFNAEVTHVGVCDPTLSTAVFVPNVMIGTMHPVINIAASVIVPHTDRRYFLLTMFLICSGLTFLLLRVTDSSLVVIIFGGIPVFTGCCFNILSSILVELFPTYIRAMAVSLTIICGRVGSMVGSYLFSLLLDSHCDLLFQLLCALLLCGAAVPLFLKKHNKLKPSAEETLPAANGKV